MSADYLFVYGTLRQGAPRGLHPLLAQYAVSLGEAAFRGRLYRVADYPGVVASDDPADKVVGEVYRLAQPGVVWSYLDPYEGCGPGFEEPTEYVREVQEVWLATGEPLRAWVYVYNWPLDEGRLIASGDFLAGA